MAMSVQARRDDLVAMAAVPATSRPEQTVTIELRDFSLGGMGGSSRLALRPEEKVTLVMPPFGTRPQTELTGRVIRCERQGETFGVGIEFCQTRSEPEASPWIRIAELFYMSGGTSERPRKPLQ